MAELDMTQPQHNTNGAGGGSNNNSTHGGEGAAAAAVLKEMTHYFDAPPMSVLIALHQIAAKEEVIDIIKLSADPALMKSYLSIHAPAVADEDEQLMNNLEATLSK